MLRATLRALVLGAVASGLLAPALADAQAAPPLLGPTPLVMRDERLVEVSVHAVPFEPGEVALTEDGIERLDALGRALATDCFLNAQAVGHAEPALADGSEPMAAHRIARSRAERVREALMEHGLPEGSIAAFWDWQLAVREPRTTLWVFQLREGADCAGRRLAPVPKVVALVPQAPAEPPPEADPPATAAVEKPPEPPPAAEAAEPEVAPPPIEALEAAEPEPPSLPRSLEPPNSPAVEEQALDPPAAQPDPPVTIAGPPPPEPPTPEPPPEASAAVVPPPPAPPPPPEQLVAEEPPALDFPFTTVVARLRPQPPAPSATIVGRAMPPAPAEASPEPEPQPGPSAPTPPAAPEPPQVAAIEADQAAADVEIVFDLNSSYLPRGAVPQLRQLVERMPRDRGWKVVLTASVSAVEQRIPDQAAAQRYNRWLAERRLGRVADWLEQNSEVRDLELVRSFAAADASRRVTVAVAPAS